MPANHSQLDYQKQLAALEVGETFAFVQRMDQDATSRADIRAAEERLANVARHQMARSKHATGFTFTGDQIDARTRATRDPVLLYIVTRTQ